MERLLELILQMQEKGYRFERIIKSDFEYFILCFKNEKQNYDCMVSAYCSSYEHKTPEEIKTILRNIHFVLQQIN